MGAASKQPPKDPPAPPTPEPRDRSDVITCNACLMRSRSALMIKPLGAGKARCVNTAACEKRQANNAKIKGAS
jgi:hypothetical protein